MLFATGLFVLVASSDQDTAHPSCSVDVQSSARGVSAPQPLGVGRPWGVCPHWGGGFHGWSDPPYHIPCCHHDGGQFPCVQCLIMLIIFLFLFHQTCEISPC